MNIIIEMIRIRWGLFFFVGERRIGSEFYFVFCIYGIILFKFKKIFKFSLVVVFFFSVVINMFNLNFLNKIKRKSLIYYKFLIL